MATELICPDCGGVIGGDESGGRQRCQCSADLTMEDTEVEAQAVPVTSAAPAVEEVKKVCCVCGKDVTHARRAKDKRGYWCYECHRADLRRERGAEKPRARCPQCGRMVPAESITSYHGETLCQKCLIEQDELPNHQKLKFKLKIDEEPAKKTEKRRIIILGVAIGFLVLLILLNRLHILPSLF
jgi:hypothetical protein